MQGQTAKGPVGFSPDTDCSFVYNRTGGTLLLGSVVMLDLGQTATETTDNLIGATTSGFANAVAPSAGSGTVLPLRVGIYGIVVGGTLTDNGLMKIQTSGVVEALVGGADAAALYDSLTPLDADTVLTSNAAAVSTKIVGIAITVTAAAADELVPILFDGIHGFGVNGGT